MEFRSTVGSHELDIKFCYMLTTASLCTNRAHILCVQPVNAVRRNILFQTRSNVQLSNGDVPFPKSHAKIYIKFVEHAGKHSNIDFLQRIIMITESFE